MKNSKLTALLLSIIMTLQIIGGNIVVVSSQDKLLEAQFRDITGHWAENNIKRLLQKGFIKGYEAENGNIIKPEKLITRAEFLTVLLKTKPSIEIIPNKAKTFKDVKISDWFRETIDKASSNGIVLGYIDETFKPNNPITRAEMASILTKFNEWDESFIDDSIKEFSDVNEKDWFYLSVMISKSMGVINGYPEGVFKPQNYALRAEAFALLDNYIERIDIFKDLAEDETIELPEKEMPAIGIEDNSPTVVDSKIALTGKGTNFVNIKWNKASDDITDVENLEYVVYYSQKDNISTLDETLENGTMIDVYEKDIDSKRITGLSNNTTYYFNVIVKDESDNKTVYEYIEIKTNTHYKGGSGSAPSSSQPESKEPLITINVSEFKPLDENESIFYVDEKVDKFTGIAENVSKLEIIVTCGLLELGKKSVDASGNWSIDNPGLIVGNNSVTITATGVNGKTVSKNIILINYSEENSEGLDLDTDDNDGDGLLNWQEDIFGTDKNNADTDGDGLTDYEEIFITFTDPLIWDTNGNGISDGEEDFDGDGLNNIQECLYGTNPYKADTDGDGLSDYDEIFVHLTNPLLIDSDNDGLSDFLEIEYGMDPNNPDSLNDGVLDGDRVFTITKVSSAWNEGDAVKPILEIELQGKQIETLSIEKVNENDIFLNTTIPGYIGNAYDFNVNGAFSNATLTFEFDQKLLDDSDFLPAIYYWNEEEQFLFEMLDQTINGNTVSAPVSHFSSYMVIAKNSYDEELFRFEILTPTDEEMQNAKYDLALVLDKSGSISSSNYNLMKNLSNNLVQSLSDEDRIAIFTFDRTVTRHSGFVDKDSAGSVISGLPNPGGSTAIYDAINMANNEFIAHSSPDTTKVMIVLTDGHDNASVVSSNSITQTAINNQIIIYTVGVGSVNAAVLTNVAQSTGGAYYITSNFSQLEGIFDRLQVDLDLYKDSDNDGISDYHEKKIAAGQLKLGNGAPMMNFASLNYLNPDSDGDGILDGKELKIKSQYVQGQEVYYCYLYSNPCMEDSDGDGLLDSEDPTPLIEHDRRFERIYDSRHRPTNSHIVSLQNESDEVYNTERAGVNDYWIREKTYLTITGGQLALMPQASAALSHFLWDIGTLYTINAKRLINQSPNAKNHLYDNLNLMLAASEDMVMDGKSMVITTNTPFIATTLSSTGSDKRQEKDWWYTIGNSSSAMTGTVTRTGKEYSMEINYFIDDFYDWEKDSPLKGGPLITDGEMYRLHEVGLAKQFPVEGCYKIKVTWSKGQRFITSTVEPSLEEVR